MSNINLYYIRGISHTDTPVFSTIGEQSIFYNTKVTKYTVPSDSFFVPKFTDEIKLPISDLDFNSQYNYLSIYFLNKYYYYFIDSIEYINEDIVSIKIEMDVIQTYMFDIDFNHSEIVRDTIKRWRFYGPDYRINRDYIRENIGNSNFIKESFELFEDDTYAFVIHIMPTNANQYWYQYDGTSPDLQRFTGSEKCLLKTSDGNAYLEAGLHLILPFAKNFPINSTYVSDVNSVTFTGTYWDMFRKMCERDYVLSVSIIPGKYLSSIGITYNSENNTFTYSTDITSRFIRISDGGNPIGVECAGFVAGGTVDFQQLKIPEVTLQRQLFGFTRNTYPEAPFNFVYCPQLLDENYTQILYGEPSYMTGYPLSHLTEPVINLRTSIDLVSNTRVYSCAISNNEDYYLTIKYATAPQLVTLYNNPYQSYLSRNQATLSAGRALALLNNVYSGITSGLGSGNAGIGIAKGAMEEINYEANRAITLSDLKFTPDTTKVNGNGAFDLITNNIAARFIAYAVSNKYECAEYFESFGYKTHEISYGNLFQRRNRYYYDYIETEDMNFTLKVITDNETVEKIRERFNRGLRMWHTLNSEFVRPSGVTLYMGQLCKYDNVEV